MHHKDEISKVLKDSYTKHSNMSQAPRGSDRRSENAGVTVLVAGFVKYPPVLQVLTFSEETLASRPRAHKERWEPIESMARQQGAIVSMSIIPSKRMSLEILDVAPFSPDGTFLEGVSVLHSDPVPSSDV